MESNNIPQLRFKEFTDEWQEKKLGDILKIGSGRDYKHLDSGNIPVYGTGGLMLNVNNYLYDGESICIGRKGTIDKPQFLKGKFWTVDTLFYTYGFKSSAPRFLFSIFQKINWQKYNEASGLPSLAKTTIEKIKVFVPSLSEQQKISEFIGTIDEKINKLEEKKKAFEKYKKGIMQSIFSQKIMFRDNAGNNYPAWQEKKLGEIGKTYNGLSGKKGDDFGRGSNFITYMQIYNNSKIDPEKFGLVIINNNERQNKVEKGDIFFTTSSETPNEVGLTSVLRIQSPDTYLNSFCFGYRLEFQDITLPEFFGYLFRSYDLRKKIFRLAQGSTRFNISKKEVMKIIINLPTIEEQKKIAEFITSLDNKIELINNKLEQTRLFKKALLQRMFA